VPPLHLPRSRTPAISYRYGPSLCVKWSSPNPPSTYHEVPTAPLTAFNHLAYTHIQGSAAHYTYHHHTSYPLHTSHPYSIHLRLQPSCLLPAIARSYHCATSINYISTCRSHCTSHRLGPALPYTPTTLHEHLPVRLRPAQHTLLLTTQPDTRASQT